MSTDTASSTYAARSYGTASTPTPCVFIIGAGLVGTTLAARLTRAGVPVAGIHGRRTELSNVASGMSGVLASSGDLPEILATADVVIISVRDARVPEIAGMLVDEKRLRPGQIVLQTAGSRPAAEMLPGLSASGASIGTMHPLIAVTDAPGTIDSLAGAYFGIEGDVDARRAAATLVTMMGGRVLELDPKAMALYHAGAVLASNYVVVLADLARSVLVAAGVPEADALPALLPLMSSAVRNLVEVGIPSAMTGPVVRGDVASVERHLAAIKDKAPALADVYLRLGQETLRIARDRVPDLDVAAVEKMAAIFGGGGGTKNGAKKTR